MNRKKMITVFFVLCIMGICVVPAQAAAKLKTGQYALLGSNLTMRLYSDGRIAVSIKGTQDTANGLYRYSGDEQTIILTFSRASGSLSAMSGMTYAYSIYNSETFTGNGETWSRIGN